MTSTLVGYFPKRRTMRSRGASPTADYNIAGCPVAPPVEEVCSVSDCIAVGPKGWREQGKHNFYGMYDTPELAWSVVPIDIRSDFELFAYWLYLTEFGDGREEPIEVWPELTIHPMPHSFVRLGWDAVEGGNHCSFGCSPLTCNNQVGNIGFESGAGIPEVNRYALVNSFEDGIQLARHFAITKPEPGPYCVVEVWRE